MSTAVTTEALPEAKATAPVRPTSGRSAAMVSRSRRATASSGSPMMPV